MNRYMIYMPAGTQGRLIPCHLDGSLTLGEMETLVDGFIDVLLPAGRGAGRPR